MNFCPKCGNKLNENDRFCSNCGEEVVIKATNTSAGKDFFNSTCAPNQQMINNTNTHPLAKASFILSLVSIGMFVIIFIIFGIYYNEESVDSGIILLLSGTVLIGMLTGIAALGTAIPGFILTKKRNHPKKIAITALVLSIIVCTFIMIIYVIAELRNV